MTNYNLTNRSELNKLLAPGALALMGAAGVAGLVALEAHGSSAANHELAAVKQAKSEFMILDSGVNVRTMPFVENADQNAGESDLAFTVPNGKKVLVKLPVESVDHDGWVGFHDPRADGQDSDHMVWVARDQLNGQDLAHEYAYGKSYQLPVELSQGNFVVKGNPDMPVADALMGDPAVIAQQVKGMELLGQ